MLRSRSATNSTAWLRRTALTVMAGSILVVCVRPGCWWSGGDAETAHPGDLLVGGQGELQETDGLELAGTLEGAGVDRVETAGIEDAGQGGLGVGVVAGDQHGGGQGADGARGKGAGERGVERLEHVRLGEGCGDLRGRGAVGGYDQRVEGLEVQRVGDVDHDLAREALATLGNDGADGGVGDREDDDVAAHRCGAVVLAEQLNGVTALACDGGDGLAHVAGTDDADVCHEVLLMCVCEEMVVATTKTL